MNEALFSSRLLQWHQENPRELPWKNTKDAYKIWLSEIILQQTRVEQGTPYYLRFIRHFPTVRKLAEADEDTVMKLWQGLGYYSRARNLHETAKNIHHHYGGHFPRDFSALKKLKGIGDYTAAAIASFAFDEPHAVVDGNVYRVLARIFGIDKNIADPASKKLFAEMANRLMGKKDPAAFNQAMMDFGATWCKPVVPLCDGCPFKRDCVAFRERRIQELPVKEKKNELRPRYFNFVLAKSGGGYLIEKRSGKDIWKGLYQFPLIETNAKITVPQLLKTVGWKRSPFSSAKIKSGSAWQTQLLSHQRLSIRFIEAGEVTLNEQDLKRYIRLTLKNHTRFGFPKIINEQIKKILHL